MCRTFMSSLGLKVLMVFALPLALGAGISSTVAQEAAVRSAFDPFQEALVELSIDLHWWSELQPEGVATDIRSKVARSRGFWAIEMIRSFGSGRITSLNAVRRPDGALVTINNAAPGSEADPEIGTSIVLYDGTVGGDDAEAMARQISPMPNYSLVPFGSIQNAQLVDDYLRGIRTRIVDDQMIVESSGALGEVTMWCDPQHGYLPSRLEIRQGPENTRGDGRIIGEIHMREGNVWPSGGIREIRQILDDVAFDHHQGQPYIKQWTLTTQVDTAAGVTVYETQKGTVHSIQFNPRLSDSQLWFSAQVPLLHPVRVHGAEYLPYVWNGTWGVPKADALHEFGHRAPGTNRRVWVLVAAVIVALACVSGWLFYRRAKHD